MLQGRFPEQSESTVRALNEGREITMAMADMFNHELREMELDPAALQLAASATFGSASRPPTGGWARTGQPRRMPSDEFVKHLTTIMLGTINGTAELLGVDLDPDRPDPGGGPAPRRRRLTADPIPRVSGTLVA